MLVEQQVVKLDEILLGSIITKSRLLGCCSLNTLKTTLNGRNQKRFVVCTTTRSTETTPHLRCPFIGQVHTSIYNQGSGPRGTGAPPPPFPGPGLFLQSQAGPRQPKTTPRRPEKPQDASKTAQDAFKTSQDAAKTAPDKPRRRQESPRRFQDGYITAQEASKT